MLRESLNIWNVADECSKEFSTHTRFIWLVKMVKAIYSDPPRLLLRPDESWNWIKETSSRRVISPGISNDNINDFFDNFYLSRSERQSKERHKRLLAKINAPEPEIIIYDKELSGLKKLTVPLESTTEPKGITPRTFREEIHRDDFRIWWESSECDELPGFWFTEEERQYVKRNKHQESLSLPTPEQIIERERKAGSIGSKRPVLRSIVAIIDEELSGEHRLTNKEIGALFPKQEHETDDCREQRGKRLRGKDT